MHCWVAVIAPHLIEEANEVVDAVLEKNSENLKEELGDLLLHVVFQAVIASEKKTFEFEAVSYTHLRAHET